MFSRYLLLVPNFKRLILVIYFLKYVTTVPVENILNDYMWPIQGLHVAYFKK